MAEQTSFGIVVLLFLCRIDASHIPCNERHFRPGDFILGGLFDELHKEDCESDATQCRGLISLQRIEAMNFALEIVNNRIDILPNVTLGFDIYDTCGKRPVALAHAISQLMSVNKWQCTERGTEEASSSMAYNDRTANNYAPVIGLVGAEWSSITTTVSPVYSTFHLPSLSYLSTSDELSDSENFPYFLRVVPPDRYQIQAIIDILEYYGLSSVSFVYTDDSYGRNALKLLKSRTNTKKNKQSMCIAEEFGINADSDYDYIMDSILSHTNSRVVILFTHSPYAKLFLRSMIKMNAVGKLQLIGSDAWGSNVDELQEYTDATSGMLKMRFIAEPVPEFEYHFGKLLNSTTMINPWSQNFLTERPLLKSGFSKESEVSLVMDSVLVYAYALDAMLTNECPKCDLQCLAHIKKNFNGTKLLHSMRIQNFHGYNRYNVSFDSNGEVKGMYDIVNMQCSSPNGECKLMQVGSWSSSDSLNVNDSSIMWGVRTMSKEHSLVPESYCESPPTSTEWSDIYAIVIVILNSFGILCTIIVAIAYTLNIKHNLISASGPEIGYLVLIGVFLSYLLVFAFIATPTNVTCYFVRIGYMLCFTTVNAPLLIHANTIFRRYRAVRRNTRRPKFTSPSSKMFFSLSLIIIQVCITIIYLIVKPPKAEIVEIFPRQRELTCNKNNTELAVSLSYNILLIILCSVHAFLTRKVPENFSESRFIGFSVYTTLVIWLFFIPSYMIVPFSNLKVVFVSVTMIISASVTLIFLFGVKIYAVYFVVDLNISRRPRVVEMSWPSDGVRSGRRSERTQSRPRVISSNINPHVNSQNLEKTPRNNAVPIQIPHSLTGDVTPFQSLVSTWL